MHPNKKSLGAAYGAYGAELFLHRKEGHFPQPVQILRGWGF
jgi:hypothetical protein